MLEKIDKVEAQEHDFCMPSEPYYMNGAFSILNQHGTNVPSRDRLFEMRGKKEYNTLPAVG